MVCLFCTIQVAFAQNGFQLENAGFEEWKSASLPVGWNTYETAQGDYASFASSNKQCKQGDAHTGNHSVCAVGRKILASIIGNGIVTSGVINAGAMSATDQSNNNQTVKDEQDKNMRFIGRPDSVVAWIKAVPKDASQLGRFYVMLHDDNNLQDPGTTWEYVIAVAGLNPPSSDKWVRHSCPFFYAGETHNIVSEKENTRTPKRELADGERPTFALVTISTNYKAGKGTDGDEIYCDDIEMIYNSKLKSLSVNGASIAGFSKDVYSYEVNGAYTEGMVTCESDGRYATIEKAYDESNGILTITVKGDDYSVNPANLHTYTVAFGCKAKLNSFEVDGVALADFSADKLEYTIDRVYNNVKSKIAYSAPQCASTSEVFDEATNTLKVTVNADDEKVYSFKFHEPYGSQLKSLTIAGNAIANFSPDTYEYTVKNTYDKSQLVIVADEEAEYTSAFDESTYTLTITVKGKDIAENANNHHTYTIHYHAPYESLLTDLKVNGVSVSGFSSTKYSYSVPDVYTEGETTVSFTESEEAVVETSYDAASQTYTIVVKGGDYDVNESNLHTYKISFHDAYGSMLTDLKINRVTIANFASDVYEYKVAQSYTDGMVTYEVDAEASATLSFDASTNRLTIVVKGGDFSSNSANSHTYVVQFCAKSVLTDLTFEGVTVPSFRSDKYNYDLSSYSYEASKVAYVVADGATAEMSYDAETSLMTIVVSGNDLELFPDNKHTYSLQFHASYGSFLTSLSLNGTLVDNFAKTNYEYLIRGTYEEYEDLLSYTADAEARVKPSFDDATNLLTLVVSGADVATNPSNVHTYKVQFYAPSSLASVKVNGVNVAGFSPDKYEYSLGSVVYETAKILYYAESNDATVEKLYDAETNILSIIVKGSDVATFEDNYKVYKFQFGKTLESKLVDLKIDGVTIEGFDRNNFQYVSNEFYNDVNVTYTADSAATVTSTYDEKNFVLMLRVEGGDIATNSSNYHEYTISFNDPTVYGSQLTNLTVNGVQIGDFSKDKYEYLIDGSYSNMKIKYYADDLAVTSEVFDSQSNSLMITVKGGNFQKDPANYHTYVLKFSTTFVFEAFVTSISVNGGAVEAFDSSKFNHSIAENYSEADVALEVSALAQYCADYDKTTGVLTIVVWAGDFETNTTNFNTYKITFKK
jgi:hypothetical protein